MWQQSRGGFALDPNPIVMQRKKLSVITITVSLTWECNCKPRSRTRNRHLNRCPGNVTRAESSIALIARSDGVSNGLNGLQKYYYDQDREMLEAVATLSGQQGPPTDLDPKHEDHLDVQCRQSHHGQGQLRQIWIRSMRIIVVFSAAMVNLILLVSSG